MLLIRAAGASIRIEVRRASLPENARSTTSLHSVGAVPTGRNRWPIDRHQDSGTTNDSAVETDMHPGANHVDADGTPLAGALWGDDVHTADRVVYSLS